MIPIPLQMDVIPFLNELIHAYGCYQYIFLGLGVFLGVKWHPDALLAKTMLGWAKIINIKVTYLIGIAHFFILRWLTETVRFYKKQKEKIQ